MRVTRRVISFAFTTLVLLPCAAQQIQAPAQVAAAPPQRDVSAVAVITQAVSAMVKGAQAPPVNALQVSGSNSPVADSGEPSGTFTWTLKITSNGIEVRNQFQSKGITSVFVSGHGSPAISSGGKANQFSGHLAIAAAPTQVPLAILLNALSNSRYTITEAKPDPDSKVPSVHVHISDDTDIITQAVTPQEWYFDPTSGLPLRVDFRVSDPQNALRWIPGSREFSNFQDVNGVLVPLQITNYLEGEAVSVTTITSVQFNPSVTDSDFDLAAGVN